MDSKIEIDVGFGTLVAYKGADPNYPGIFIDFCRKDGIQCSVAGVDVPCPDDVDDANRVNVYVWGKGTPDEDVTYETQISEDRFYTEPDDAAAK